MFKRCTGEQATRASERGHGPLLRTRASERGRHEQVARAVASELGRQGARHAATSRASHTSKPRRAGLRTASKPRRGHGRAPAARAGLRRTLGTRRAPRPSSGCHGRATPRSRAGRGRGGGGVTVARRARGMRGVRLGRHLGPKRGGTRGRAGPRRHWPTVRRGRGEGEAGRAGGEESGWAAGGGGRRLGRRPGWAVGRGIGPREGEMVFYLFFLF
jgi:hypothetical protein